MNRNYRTDSTNSSVRTGTIWGEQVCLEGGGATIIIIIISNITTAPGCSGGPGSPQLLWWAPPLSNSLPADLLGSPPSLPVTQWSTAPFRRQQQQVGITSGSVRRGSQQQRLKTATSERRWTLSGVHTSLARRESAHHYPARPWKRCEAGCPAAPSCLSSGSESPNQTVRQVGRWRFHRNPAH